jgi:hypothetical protein
VTAGGTARDLGVTPGSERSPRSPGGSVLRTFLLPGAAAAALSLAACGGSPGGDAPKDAAGPGAPPGATPAGLPVDDDPTRVRLRYLDVRDLLDAGGVPAEELRGVAASIVGPDGSAEVRNGILLVRGTSAALDAVGSHVEDLRAKAGGPTAARGGAPAAYTAPPAPPAGPLKPPEGGR